MALCAVDTYEVDAAFDTHSMDIFEQYPLLRLRYGVGTMLRYEYYVIKQSYVAHVTNIRKIVDLVKQRLRRCLGGMCDSPHIAAGRPVSARPTSSMWGYLQRNRFSAVPIIRDVAIDTCRHTLGVVWV